jgi:hypothetical protein
VLYHFGSRDLLEKDARAGNVPKDDWDKYIMGDQTDYDLPPFRRGLYGTVHPSQAEIFGDWFMAVGLDASCRTPEAVAVPSYLLEDGRFQSWFAAQPHPELAGLEAIKAACFRPSAQGFQPRLILNVQNVDIDTKIVEGPCERMLQKFYADQGIKIVLDEQWPDQDVIENNIVGHISWYIRDRNCIRSIKSESQDMPHVLAQLDDPWKGGGALGVWDKPEFTILLTALAEAKGPIDPDDLYFLNDKAASSKINWSMEDAKGNDIGTVYLSVAAAAVVSAYDRCRYQFDRTPLQGVLKQFLKERTRVSDIGGLKEMNVGNATENMIRRLDGVCR